MIIIDEETYLAINGGSFSDIGDLALHHNKGNNSDKTWHKIVKQQHEKDVELCKKREELRKEYKEKCANGELRPPTKLEQLIKNSQGHTDNESTHAAIRLLEKYKLKIKQND